MANFAKENNDCEMKCDLGFWNGREFWGGPRARSRQIEAQILVGQIFVILG